MQIKLKLYHLLLVLISILIIFKFDLIFNSFEFLFLSIQKTILGGENFNIVFNLPVVDVFVSLILLIILPIIIYLFREKHIIFNYKLTLSSFAFLVLIFCVIFAPMITDFHPNAQPNLRATRFMKPLSSIFVLHMKEDSNKPEYFKIKEQIIKSSVLKDKLFANSYKEDGSYVFYNQGLKESRISKDSLETKNNHVVVSRKIFVLGTDELGRDIFSRVIYGARVSLFIATLSVTISLLIGLFLGFTAVRVGGIFNLVLSRITDMFLTIPTIFFVIIVLAFWGNSIYAVIIVLGLTGWMNLFKIVKGELSLIVKKDYYITSVKLGLSQWKLLTKEILPAITTQLIIFCIFQFSNVILAEASLSYLGLGVGINFPSWGNMVLSGQKYMSSGPWLIIIPSIILIISILVINDFGEKYKNEMNPWVRNDKS